MNTSHLFRHPKNKVQQICPRKNIFENIQLRHLVPFAWSKWLVKPGLPGFDSYGQIYNPEIEVPLCGDGLEATPCMSWGMNDERPKGMKGMST